MSLQAIESIKHFAGKANELQSLRDRVQELEELLGLAREQADIFHRLKLSPQQKALLGLLYRSNLVRRYTAYNALYGARQECEQPEDRILDVQICKIRTRLMPLGISIETQRAAGWFMTAENKERLSALIGDKSK